MGGLEKEKFSLLTVFIIAVDDNFNVIDELYLYLKPNDGIYKVCAQGMAVNKIDLVKHDTVAISYKEGSTKLYNWLKKVTEGNKEKAIVVGHGIYGDVEWIVEHLINRGSWETFTSYRKLDTSSTCQFLKACGLFPESVSGSLISLAKYFGVEVNEDEAHDAKYDTMLTFKVFLSLRKLFLPIKHVKIEVDEVNQYQFGYGQK